MTSPHLIRKYANRRLYDATDSRHVTLDDIRKLIVQGTPVKVVDDRSGEELTRAVMLQIISEQEQFGSPVLSTELLEAIIRFYGNPVQSLLSRYLEQSVGSLLRQQQIMQTEMAKALETPFAPVAELARRNMELWMNMQASMLSSMSPGAPAGAAPPPPAAAPEDTPRKPPRRGSSRKRK